MFDRLQVAAAEFGRLVYPPICLLCDRDHPPDGSPFALCADCRTAVTADPHDCCPRCSSTVGPHADTSAGCPRCRDESFAFAGVVRLGPYDGLLRDAVLRSKSLAGESLAETLGRLFAVTRRERLLLDSPQVVVPVALHWMRRLGRGYNQSAAVADGLASVLGLPSRPGWLRRVTRTPPQTSMTSATARRENLRNAFAVPTRAVVRGVRVLLVDDVLTTGATADAAARALRRAGAAQVRVAVLSHR